MDTHVKVIFLLLVLVSASLLTVNHWVTGNM